MYAFSATSRCIPLIIELGYLLSASRREWRQSGVKENGCVLCRNSSRSCKLPVQYRQRSCLLPVENAICGRLWGAVGIKLTVNVKVT